MVLHKHSKQCLRAYSTISLISPSFYSFIIRASIEKGALQKALLDYKAILFSGTIQPDHRTLSSVLDACKILLNIRFATSIHARVIKTGFQLYPSVLAPLVEALEWGADPLFGNLIVDGYMKSGEFDNANKVFKQMSNRDVVSWNLMIAGGVRNARPKEALSIFQQMLGLNFKPNGFTFSSVLSGCARTGALREGKRVHQLMIEHGIELNSILSSALVDMYSKCGRIQTAKQVFDNVQRKDVSVWNAMITGLAIHGLALDVMELFSRMEGEGVTPDSITFLGILTACSHCGLVEEGCRHFDLMRSHYSIEPQLEHYGAMVDQLSRAGLLEEAYTIIKAMPMEPDMVTWRALLSACRTHGNAKLGEVAVEQMASLYSGDCVLLSNIYSASKRWDNAERVRDVMKKMGIRKNRGLSWVEMGGFVHQFKAGDRSHPESNTIREVLGRLSQRIKMEGFVPMMDLVLMDVSEEEKEGNLNLHSEKLATAYWILKTSPGTEIRVSKNLRTCHDCHGWMKMVSRVLNRVIVVRDRIRFHRFENGSCSCGDYW
ncbi:pentatricopeptide repeat-containing protein At5g50990 isoform X2 [Telopea speciosissima]|uniref:pentatricopeptide repeat-containing protein At5g50990 isoform X2 n=1 Tax=Telopea speciosissima TaxID=54955 RepID=UPI001CC3E49C|nr:pentatricopeptide repeat-containing protein At5g50990 isoform X2 [Telopea speciosissima]